MKLSEIPVEKVLLGTTWLVEPMEGDPNVREATSFTNLDEGLFSSIMKMNDGTEHPALIVKNFADGGLHTDTYLHTRGGWMNLFDEGLMRAVGKYHHDIFPFEIFIGRPWSGDKELAKEGAEKIQDHIANFLTASTKIKETLQKA